MRSDPSDTIANTVHVAKLATGEIEEEYVDERKQAGGRKGGEARTEAVSPRAPPRDRPGGRQGALAECRMTFIPRCAKTIGPILGETQDGYPIRKKCPGKLSQRGVAPGWGQCEVCGALQELPPRDDVVPGGGR